MAAEPTPRPDPAAEEVAARVRALEEEQAERVALAHAALARAQDRAYWLDRWNLDLNSLMRRRGASEARSALRLLRLVIRRAVMAKRAAQRGARGLPAATRAARRGQEDTGSPPSAREPRFERTISPDPLRASPVTDLLLARLPAESLAALEAAAGAELESAADDADRRRVLLEAGLRRDAAGVRERTGLAAGDRLYHADLVVDALERAGVRLGPGARCLDFGCAPEGTVSVLAAAYPDAGWHGCGASRPAGGVAFEPRPDVPLPYEDGALDVAYALASWSRTTPPAALAWLHEMRRVLRPGGALLVAADGHAAIAHDHRRGLRSAAELAEARNALYEDGFWLGEGGAALFTPEWLLGRIGSDWCVASFAAGRLEDRADVYVLERR